MPSRVEAMIVNQIVLCHVCGNEGASKHFGGICCAPSKMFFRRNVQYRLETSACHFGGLCNVTINTRHACRICRFKKCLFVGMQKELLRASRLPSRPAIDRLDLLRSDRSLLTKDQWNFLSNIIHAYDNTSPISNILVILNAQTTYPLKIRMKRIADNFSKVISSVFRALHPYAQKLSDFSSLQIRDQTELVQRHLRTVGGFGGIFILREANLCSSSIYKYTLALHYGSEIYEESLRIVDRHEVDGTIIKLFIATLVFSTCTDVVQPPNYYHHNNKTINQTHSFSNTKQLIQIQNTYVDIMFKYMLYRHGSRDATLRFAGMIKNFLDQGLCLIKAGEHYKVQNELIENIRSEIVKDSMLRETYME